MIANPKTQKLVSPPSKYYSEPHRCSQRCPDKAIARFRVSPPRAPGVAQYLAVGSPCNVPFNGENIQRGNVSLPRDMLCNDTDAHPMLGPCCRRPALSLCCGDGHEQQSVLCCSVLPCCTVPPPPLVMTAEATIAGSIAEFSPDFSGGFRIVAQGIRNTLGMAFHPTTDEMWFTDNGRDQWNGTWSRSSNEPYTWDNSSWTLSGSVFTEVRDPTTWTITRHDGPNHLGLWCNAP